jgi:hypothetical protein
MIENSKVRFPEFLSHLGIGILSSIVRRDLTLLVKDIFLRKIFAVLNA